MLVPMVRLIVCVTGLLMGLWLLRLLMLSRRNFSVLYLPPGPSAACGGRVMVSGAHARITPRLLSRGVSGHLGVAMLFAPALFPHADQVLKTLRRCAGGFAVACNEIAVSVIPAICLTGETLTNGVNYVY